MEPQGITEHVRRQRIQPVLADKSPCKIYGRMHYLARIVEDPRRRSPRQREILKELAAFVASHDVDQKKDGGKLIR